MWINCTWNSTDLILLGNILDLRRYRVTLRTFKNGSLGHLWLCVMQEAQPETRQGGTWEMQCVRCPSFQPAALQVQQRPHRVSWQITVTLGISHYLGRLKRLNRRVHVWYVWSLGDWLQHAKAFSIICDIKHVRQHSERGTLVSGITMEIPIGPTGDHVIYNNGKIRFIITYSPSPIPINHIQVSVCHPQFSSPFAAKVIPPSSYLQLWLPTAMPVLHKPHVSSGRPGWWMELFFYRVSLGSHFLNLYVVNCVTIFWSQSVLFSRNGDNKQGHELGNLDTMLRS